MTFAQIIRSAPDVREAFAGHGIARIWGLTILRLHGKPCSAINSVDRRSILASGFRFYGRLYAVVAFTFLVAAFISALAQNHHSVPLTMAAAYLGMVSRIAIVGAERYENDVIGSSASLITFFVGVMVFAACFIGSAATIAILKLPEQAVLISFVASGTLTLGVGSYLLEILFLLFDTVRSEST